MKTAFFAAFMLLSFSFFTRPAQGSSGDLMNLEFPPGPQLLSPVTDDVRLAGKDFVEFKWRFPNQIDTDYFSLRVYRGYQAYADNLIFRQRYSVSELPPKLPASFFKPGDTYTWVLVQVYKDGRKSEPVSSPFKITKQ